MDRMFTDNQMKSYFFILYFCFSRNSDNLQIAASRLAVMHILIEDFDETFEYKELKGASDIFLTLCDKAGPSQLVAAILIEDITYAYDALKLMNARNIQ